MVNRMCLIDRGLSGWEFWRLTCASIYNIWINHEIITQGRVLKLNFGSSIFFLFEFYRCINRLYQKQYCRLAEAPLTLDGLSARFLIGWYDPRVWPQFSDNFSTTRVMNQVGFQLDAVEIHSSTHRLEEEFWNLMPVNYAVIHLVHSSVPKLGDLVGGFSTATR